MPRKQSIQVCIVHHPIETRNVTVVEIPFRRQSLAEIKHQFTNGQEVRAVLDSKEIEPGAWSSTPVPADSKVILVPAAAGPLEALWVFEIFGVMVGTILVNAAWAMAMVYLGGVLFGQSIPEPGGAKEGGQSFAWNPITTQKAGGVRPHCYGTNMHYGNVVARWTDVDDSGDEVLYMILDYGDGPVKGKGANIVYLNDQPVGNFPGVSVQERLGTFNQTCMEGFEENKLEYKMSGGLVTNSGDPGPMTWTSPNNFFDDLEYTLSWPRGLYYYDDMGDRRSHGVGVKVQISERGLNTWTTLMDTTINGDQLAPVYKAYRVSKQGFICEHGKQYDLKYSKTSTDQTDGRHGDEFRVRNIREVVKVAFTRPGKALIGIRALATDRLSGHINVKFVADDKLVNIYNGSTWEIGFTRNRAWITLAEFTQPIISGDGDGNPWVIERYEGLDPSMVDLAFFYEWAEWCAQQVLDGKGGTEDRMTCDIICDYQTDVWSLGYELSQVGRMYPYWQGTILTGWIDKAVDEVFDLVTMDNTMLRSWRSGWAGHGEMAGEIDVFFKDRQEGYERKSHLVPNEDAGSYKRNVSIEGIGVTGKALATRVGNHILQRNKLIKNVNSVRMWKDALRYRLGKVVRLQSNIPGWGKSYRVIVSEANNTCVLDRVIEASAGDILYVKSYDEVNKRVSLDSYTVASAAGRTVTIAETWDVTPARDNIAAIGMPGDIKLRRIVKMRHTVDNYFDVDFETYDEVLFDSDDIPPYIDNPDYCWPQPASPLTKPITQWESIDLISQMIPPQPDIDVPWTSNLEWNGDNVDTISWSKRDAAKPILFRYHGVTHEITPDSTTDDFIYWDPNYTTQFRTTNVISVALAGDNWLVCTNKDGIAHPVILNSPMDGQIIEVGTIDTAQLVNLAITTEKLNALAVTLAKIDNNAVDATKIVAGSITTAEIAALTIAAGNIAANAITAAKINALAVETGKLAALAVTTGKLAANAVTAAKIAANTITANEMAANSIATVALQANSVTAGIIQAAAIFSSHYAEIRNTYVFNSEDSLDASKAFTIPFEIVAELNTIMSIKLSFRIMPYRAYSTAAASGGGSTSGNGGGATGGGGGGQTSSGASGWPLTEDTSDVNWPSTENADLRSHGHEVEGSTESEDCGGGVHAHDIDRYNCSARSTNLGSHAHTIYGYHHHEYGLVDHTHIVDDHTHTGPVHAHSTPNHVHGITYAIHEESNSPTVHYHIDNGAGFGGPSANYTTDQLDLVISGSISGAGWKAIRFDTDLRCRIAAIIVCKLDIDA